MLLRSSGFRYQKPIASAVFRVLSSGRTLVWFWRRSRLFRENDTEEDGSAGLALGSVVDCIGMAGFDDYEHTLTAFRTVFVHVNSSPTTTQKAHDNRGRLEEMGVDAGEVESPGPWVSSRGPRPLTRPLIYFSIFQRII